MAEELHQEFLLRICEVGEQKFIDIKNSPEGDYTSWYCMEIISNLWNNKGRVKKYSVGSTNHLFEITSESIDIEAIRKIGSEPEDDDEDPVHVREVDVYDFKIDLNYNEIKEILNQDINSDDKDLNYQARAFAYSNGFDINKDGIIEGGPCKNARQFSNVAKIPYKSVWAATSSYLKKLKLKVND